MAAETLTLPSIIPIPSTAERHITQYAGRYWEDDVVNDGYTYRNGSLYLSDLPGLGITVDETKVAKYAVTDPTVSTPTSLRHRSR
jgi:L-alanine-DL-glutamate epimerase-like enolase superfamily enzyme